MLLVLRDAETADPEKEKKESGGEIKIFWRHVNFRLQMIHPMRLSNASCFAAEKVKGVRGGNLLRGGGRANLVLRS